MRLHLVACLIAAAVPLLPIGPSAASASTRPFPGWPTSFEGRALRELPLDPALARFAEELPGRLGRFTDGERTLAIWWLDAPTRHLHGTLACLEGTGWSVTPLPVRRDARGRLWGTVEARRADETLRVSRRIEDADGREFLDASAWYWAALLDRSRGPWWVWTVAESAR